MLTTDQKGAIAESEIVAAAIKLGCGVDKPVIPLLLVEAGARRVAQAMV